MYDVWRNEACHFVSDILTFSFHSGKLFVTVADISLGDDEWNSSREINLWSIKKFWISDLLYIHIEILETDIRSINARLSLIPKSQILMLNQMWFNWFFLVLYQRGLGWGIKIVPWLFSSSLLDYNLAQYVKITLVEFLIHEVFFYYLLMILVWETSVPLRSLLTIMDPIFD